MRRLLIAMVLVACGPRPSKPTPTPAAASVPADAAPVAENTPDAGAGNLRPAWYGCCSGGSWVCDRMPEPDEDCRSIARGCCSGGGWSCDRLPEPGESCGP